MSFDTHLACLGTYLVALVHYHRSTPPPQKKKKRGGARPYSALRRWYKYHENPLEDVAGAAFLSIIIDAFCILLPTWEYWELQRAVTPPVDPSMACILFDERATIAPAGTKSVFEFRGHLLLPNAWRAHRLAAYLFLL